MPANNNNGNSNEYDQRLQYQRAAVVVCVPTIFLSQWLSGGGYNYDSTSTRLQFDRAATIRRSTSRPRCCAAA